VDESPNRKDTTNELLRRSEEHFLLLVTAVVDYAIFLLDREGHVATWNVGAERIKGYRPDEIIGKHFSIFYPEEALQRGWPQYELKVAREVGRFEDEGWRIRKDGSRFWANVIITALHDDAGQFVGYCKITRDLTERRRAEKQARQLAHEQAARAAAEEGVRAQDQFLSTASHELCTPLNPLQIHIQLLLKAARDGSLHGPLRDRAAGMLESCERQVRHFTRIVNELLDVSRIAAGRLDLHRAELDLAALARDVAGRFAPEMEQVGCALHVHAEQPAVGWWDAGRLEEVIANLLSNVMMYGRGKPVEVTVEPGAGSALLSVRDQGIGIAPEDQDRIFQRFERAVSGHEYVGLGIGLYRAREIVRAHGGTIRVASAPGAGATFAVELPYGKPAPQATGS
jgi:PAS domain S-box-containing protein